MLVEKSPQQLSKRTSHREHLPKPRDCSSIRAQGTSRNNQAALQLRHPLSSSQQERSLLFRSQRSHRVQHCIAQLARAWALLACLYFWYS